ncbi:MAG: flagellar hook-basal body complex protein [bacterium]|jgi:flagellar hook-basal body protein
MTVRSLYVGYSGLNAMSKNIDVIGNNIANVNTVGYRAGRATFDDVFYQTLYAGVGATGNRGGRNPMQLGTGAQLGSIDKVFTQGATQSTGRLLDLAVNGEGFFVLRNGAGQEFLTRAGNFSLDEEGFIVDPSTGYKLIGRSADENGEIQENAAPGELQLNFNSQSPALQTQNVRAGGNFDARVGDPNSDVGVQIAQKTTNLLGLFNQDGTSLGFVNGDVIRFESGYFDISNPPGNVQNPIDLSSRDIGKGAGVIMTISSSTTVKDLQDALNQFLNSTMTEIKPGDESGIEIQFKDGSFEFANYGANALKGIRVGLNPRAGQSTPPTEPNRILGELFINEGDPDFSKTLNVYAGETVSTSSLRKADRTTSIDVFDSQGVSHTVTVGLARDTSTPAATANTLVHSLKDSQGRFLIPDGVVPPKPVFTDPVINNADNTAVYTAHQISNIVVTQGVYTFEDGSGNLVALRLSDGALSFNGGAFSSPVLTDETIDPEFAAAGIDVTGDAFLNLPSAANTGGGLLGDAGFSESTTLEDIRSNIENRLNAAIRQVASNIANLDPGTSTIHNIPATITAPAEIPQIKVTLTEDGSFSFSSTGGSLGSSVSTDPTINDALLAQVGGTENMGLVLDLAAKTRSIRVSTTDPRGTITDPTDDFNDGMVDNDYSDGGGVTGFLTSGDPFSSDITQAFAVGNTDFDLLDTTGDPTATPPTGIDDSGVRLIALSSGKYSNADSLASEGFADMQAFTPEITAFSALFNQRGYGIPANFDGRAGIDRPASIPVGVVAQAGGNAFETNTITRDGITRNTVNYQVVTPSDSRTVPSQNTGTLYFNSQGRFVSYGNNDEAPSITFDPDNGDPQDGGVDPVNFRLDMSGITHFSQAHSAQLQSQDGRPVGNLDNVSIAANGEIIGIFTNGDSHSLGQIMLATVRNESGLIQEGDTMFTVAPNAGERLLVEAGNGGGVITSGTLELSNVDLAQEFTNLIVAQRAFQANARTITTGDQVLTEIVSLKR